MKSYNKKFLVIILCCLSITSMSQTRQVNLSYKIVNLNQYDEVKSPKMIPVHYRLYNEGPDTLWTCDSFASSIEHSLDYPYKPKRKKFALFAPIYPGDSSAIYFDSSYVNFKDSADNVPLYLTLILGRINTDYTHPKGSPIQVFSGDDGGTQKVILIHKTGFSNVYPTFEGELKIYPNPVFQGLAYIKNVGLASIKKISVIDLYGREIEITNNHELRNDQIKLEFHNLISGMYILTIHSSLGTITRRIIIEN